MSIEQARKALEEALRIYDSNAPLGPYAAEALTREALSALSRIEGEPVAWRCRDYADGWILFNDEIEARRYRAESGAFLQPLYALPAPPEPEEGPVEGKVTPEIMAWAESVFAEPEEG